MLPNTEIMIYKTRKGRWRARVRNKHGTVYTDTYRKTHGVLFEAEHILEGVSTAEGQPSLNPEAAEAHVGPHEAEG